ncbi:MAG TPA: hypothetical protein VJR70_07365 [Stellaceae bacterium]|nr:hypothetical protein [Stellaceae bacterium]
MRVPSHGRLRRGALIAAIAAVGAMFMAATPPAQAQQITLVCPQGYYLTVDGFCYPYNWAGVRGRFDLADPTVLR